MEEDETMIKGSAFRFLSGLLKKDEEHIPDEIDAMENFLIDDTYKTPFLLKGDMEEMERASKITALFTFYKTLKDLGDDDEVKHFLGYARLVIQSLKKNGTQEVKRVEEPKKDENQEEVDQD